MSAIKDEIRIEGNAARVFAALTTQAGYRGWWHAVALVPEGVRGEATLQFVQDGSPVNMRFRIGEARPSTLVRWSCVAHDFPSWVGTSLTWRVAEAPGSVLLSLVHDGWADAPPERVAQGWKHFLASLKSYVETGTGQPG